MLAEALLNDAMTHTAATVSAMTSLRGIRE